MSESENQKLDRRQLITRAAKAGLTIAGAGLAAKLMFDPDGPGVSGEDKKQVLFPDYSVAAQAGKTMSVVKGMERQDGVRKAIELLGGIDRFVMKGDVVVIKPNVAFASPPMLGATTSPDIVVAVIELCYKAGAKKVIVADNPINDPQSCFMISGIGAAVEKAGAQLMLPKSFYFKHTTLAGGKLINNWPVFFEPFANANKVIGIAPVKDHHRSGASLTMKNWYGLLGGRRNIFHQDIYTIVTELAMMIKPTLVILDGTTVMLTNGPTGGSTTDLKTAKTIIASCDMVAADTYGAQLLGLGVNDLPFLSKAEKAGVGTTDWNSLKPIIAG